MISPGRVSRSDAVMLERDQETVITAAEQEVFMIPQISINGGGFTGTIVEGVPSRVTKSSGPVSDH